MTPQPLATVDEALPDGLEATLSQIASDAGREIMTIYEDAEDVEIDRKADDSPLTEADTASHHTTVDALRKATPEIPVLSEESKGIGYDERSAWDLFWLVDPLDGTKEFIKRNGEFTVNIALVHQGEPVAGIVHAPDLDATYYGEAGHGATKTGPGDETVALEANAPGEEDTIGVVVSRSHLNDATQAYVDRIEAAGHAVDLVPTGSSLKFCRIAEGAAHVYPRLAPTMEWDTAAAQAVLEAAGGLVVEAEDGRAVPEQPLVYNKQELLNPHFVAAADRSLLGIGQG